MDQRLAGRFPLVAILRGLEPERALDVAEVLIETGVRIIEVPMNSRDAVNSVEAIATRYSGQALIGAGTVLSTLQVDKLADAGAELIVSPNSNTDVIARTAAKGMISLPGAITPTEMFAAIDAGANGLKIFPAELYPPAALKAARTVLPKNVPIYVVGGIHTGNMIEYRRAGSTGFGVGSSIFEPGKSLEDIARDSRALVESFHTSS